MNFTDRLKQIAKQTDVMMAMAVVGIVMMMVLPIPRTFMDLFLAFSITLALIVLLMTIYIEDPLQFSVFPSILLILTLFRLSLNIATTRLILIDGHTGPHAAGKVIMSFGQFVVGGNYVVGIIVFLILVIINFIVITKGAGRIAEVAARFVLDSMPGKQMSIDADLNAGIINETEAKQRRKAIEDSADFYGAMDGASKFVRGDAIAGLLITGINIVAGFIIGVAQNDMTMADAAATYTILTVGDGLVSQIPALITSTAAGMLVTRSASDTNLGEHLYKQLLEHWRVLGLVGGFLLFFAIVPGMPSTIFIILSGLLLTAAFYSRRYVQKKRDAIKEEKAIMPTEPEVSETDRLEAMLPLDMLSFEVGYGLVNLVDAKQGGELLERITALRRQFVTTMGIVIPPIHIRDNLELPANLYVIHLKGAEIARGEVMADKYLAMNPGDVMEEVDGIETVEPAFGLPAIWIDQDKRTQAEAMGYTVVDASTVMATHLAEVLKQYAHDLLGRPELQSLLDIFSKSTPNMVEDLIPALLSLGEVLRVMRNLLKEGISIRDLRTILETLADMAPRTKNTEVLTEIVRQRLAKSITSRFKTPDNQLYAIMLDAGVEDMVRNSQRITDDEIQVAINPDQARSLLQELEAKLEEISAQAVQPVLLVSPEIRKAIFNFLQRFMPDLPVMSHREVDPGVDIQLVGTVGAKAA